MMQEVLRRGVLLQPSYEIGDRHIEVGGGHDGRVEQHGTHALLDSPRLAGGHSLQHLHVHRMRDAAASGQQVREGQVIEVVTCDSYAYAGCDVGTQGPVKDAHVGCIGGGLAGMGSALPAVQFGVHSLHGKVGALDQPDLDPGSAGLSALFDEMDESLKYRENTREIKKSEN